ncbi:phage virion morphogenesis protein [Azonexus sp.]|uniref:phage virion morphogenesis protein n=1 Tax=Azonexus sp. TaxID=1872668 RepID=UPI0035B408D7
MDFKIKVDDAQVLGALNRLLALGRDASPAMREVADLGEASTRLRFRLERGPDGQRWKPSLRAQMAGGRTLTKDGHLGGSINSQSGHDFAEWGVNRIYAAIHQFGGEIRAKAGGALKFPLPNGGFAVVKAVRMPARPFLGVNDDDRDDILEVFERHIGSATGGATRAG